MGARLFAVALAALVLPGAALAADEAAHCQLRQLAEIPVSTNGWSPSVAVEIDGHPARMIIDTGSQFTMLTSDAAQGLGLTPAPDRGIEFYGVGGKERGRTVRIKEFKIGDFVGHNLEWPVSSHFAKGLQGLLGAGFLLQTDIEFDLPEGKIRFFKSEHCAGDQVVYWGTAYAVAPLLGPIGSKLDVTVRLNGVPVTAEMDTGAGDSMVTTAIAASAGVTVKSSGVVSGGAMRGLDGQPVQVFVGVFRTFAFGEETISNARIAVADMFGVDKEALFSRIPTSMVGLEMLLGADFFRSHRIYVAREQRRVYVSYVGGPVFLAPRPPAPAPAAPAR
jgi:predicted aspartyl protease